MDETRLLALLLRYQPSLDEGDTDALAGVLTPDFVFEPMMGAISGGTVHGLEAFRTWAADFAAAFEGVTRRTDAVEPVGDDLWLVQQTLSARGRAGGVPVEQTMYLAMELRGEQVAWMAARATKEEALAAALARRPQPDDPGVPGSSA